MKISEYIKFLRVQKGISQEKLGEIVGVQRAAVQKWETETECRTWAVQKNSDSPRCGISIPARFCAG